MGTGDYYLSLCSRQTIKDTSQKNSTANAATAQHVPGLTPHRPRTSTVPKASNPEQKAIEWGGQISNWCPDIQNKTRTLLWQELHSHRVRHCWRQPRLWSRSKLNTGAKRTQRLQHRGGKNRSLNKTRDTQFLFHYEYIKSLCGFFTPDGASHTCAPHSGQLPAMLPHDQG